MHQSSLEKMSTFCERYLSSKKDSPMRILDLGSQDVNGSYRQIFSSPQWSYVGIDMAAGKNVDVVLKTPYVWKEIESSTADVVVSGQAFEHIEYFWITMLEVNRVLKPGGICCILAPSSGPEHRYPTDCWRFYPDGMASLARYAQLDVLEATTQWKDMGYVDGSDNWHDSMLVCRKPNNGFWWNKKSGMKRRVQHWANTVGLKLSESVLPSNQPG